MAGWIGNDVILRSITCLLVFITLADVVVGEATGEGDACVW